MNRRAVAVNESEVREKAFLDLSNDSQQLAKYAAVGCTDSELADIFGVPEDEMARTHDALLKKARAELRMRIRNAQLRAADKGDPDALAYLTKAYL